MRGLPDAVSITSRSPPPQVTTPRRSLGLVNMDAVEVNVRGLVDHQPTLIRPTVVKDNFISSCPKVIWTTTMNRP